MFGQGQLVFLFAGVVIGLALSADGRGFLAAAFGKLTGLFRRKSGA